MYTRRQKNKRSTLKGKQNTLIPAPSSSGIQQSAVNALAKPYMLSYCTFPNQLTTVMRWTQDFSMTTAAGSSTVQDMRLTSLYDPNFTGAGTQPKYFDTLCGASGSTAPYGQYRVLKSYYRVQFMNGSSTSTTGFYGFVQPFIQNPVSSAATIAYTLDSANLAYVIGGPSGNQSSNQGISGVVDIAKFVGVKDIKDDEDLLAAYNANPALNVFLRVGVRAQDDTTVFTLRVLVTLCYDVEFLSLNDAGNS